MRNLPKYLLVSKTEQGDKFVKKPDKETTWLKNWIAGRPHDKETSSLEGRSGFTLGTGYSRPRFSKLGFFSKTKP
jgi:hypothetical protein